MSNEAWNDGYNGNSQGRGSSHYYGKGYFSPEYQSWSAGQRQRESDGAAARAASFSTPPTSSSYSTPSYSSGSYSAGSAAGASHGGGSYGGSSSSGAGVGGGLGGLAILVIVLGAIFGSGSNNSSSTSSSTVQATTVSPSEAGNTGTAGGGAPNTETVNISSGALRSIAYYPNTGRLVLEANGHYYTLYGVEVLQIPNVNFAQSRAFAEFGRRISAYDGTIQCDQVPGAGYKCLLETASGHQRYDISKFAIVLGAARPTPNAPDDYQTLAGRAKLARKGNWGGA